MENGNRVEFPARLGGWKFDPVPFFLLARGNRQALAPLWPGGA
jgi:hypothetical protein